MNKKIAVVTGANGGVGSGFVHFLSSLGWDVYAVVRSFNESAKALIPLPGVTVVAVQQDSIAEVRSFIQNLHEEGIVPTLIILAAGGRGPRGEFYDDEFPGGTMKEQQEEAIRGHTASSVTTKEIFLKELVGVYSDIQLKHMTLIIIGSHAESFSLEERLRFKEVGYAQSMWLLGPLYMKFSSFFGKAFHEKPGLIRTTLTKEKLSDALADPTREVKEPEQYAQEVMVKTGLL